MFVYTLFVVVSVVSTPLFATAWSPSKSIQPVRQYHQLHSFQDEPKHWPSSTQLAATKTPDSSQPELSSAYDRILPPSLVGEAVRSALRSDRGICFDFTRDRYDGGGGSPSNSRLVSVVGVQGKGTRAFLNAKFSQSVPRGVGGSTSTFLSKKMELVRKGNVVETGYLTSKGRIIDRLLTISFLNESEDELDEAFLVTSPGNSGSTLYNELSPLIFPMDGVELSDFSTTGLLDDATTQTHVITLACASLNDAQTSFRKNILHLLSGIESQSFEFPAKGSCHHYRASEGTEEADVYLMQHTFLPAEACHGYTLLIRGNGSLATQIWDNLTDEDNNEGPVGLGSLEYETLRIEAGHPAYGHEMTGDGAKKISPAHEKLMARRRARGDEGEDNPTTSSESDNDKYYSKANPLELHLQRLVDTEKGCYQGQEGVASMIKNKRGFPRMLYQVVFRDSENDFDGDGGFGIISIDNDEIREFQQLKKQANQLPNDTRQPQIGDELYVLGSNKRIKVGTITSVAQPNGTGEAKTIALALVRRPGPILDGIKDMDLELPRWWEDVDDDDDYNDESEVGIAKEKGDSGIMKPPPLDPLHNLEVTIGDTYTVGRLQSVPSRRYGYASKGDNRSTLYNYEQRGEVVADSNKGPGHFRYEFKGDSSDGVIDATIQPETNQRECVEDDIDIMDVDDDDDNTLTDELLAEAEEEAAKAALEAERAAAEAKRKTEKMEQLKARAEAAKAARKKKKPQS